MTLKQYCVFTSKHELFGCKFMQEPLQTIYACIAVSLGNADGFVVFSHLTIFEIIIIEKIPNNPLLYFELNLTEFLTAIILIKEQYEN